MATRYARRENAVHASLPTWEVARREGLLKRAREYQEEEERYKGVPKIVGNTIPAAPGRRFPVTRRQAALDGEPRGRELAEDAERQRWITKLTVFIQGSGAEVASREGEGLHHHSVAKLLAAGRRASTLRARVRAWVRFRKWLRESFDTDHPRSSRDALDYLLVRADEPCSISVIKAIRALYGFIDDVTAARGLQRLSSDSLLSFAFKELVSQASDRQSGASRKARRPLVAMLLAVESLVIDESAMAYQRMLG